MTEPNHSLLECRLLGRELPALPTKAAKKGSSAEPNPSPRVLLSDVSFKLAAGEILAILGPSGAGKSTLLRLLNRLDEPTHGTVLFHGEDYRTPPPSQLRRQIGMILQRAYLFPGDAASNIRFGPSQYGKTISDTEIDSLLDSVGLPGFAARDAKTLSGGEAQRVAIARALANEPEVLLLDEPTSALDDASKQSIEALLLSIVHQRHLSCVWITHDRAQAGRVADAALFLAAGRTTACGNIHDPAIQALLTE